MHEALDDEMLARDTVKRAQRCRVGHSSGRNTDPVNGSKPASSCAPAGYRFPRVIAVAVRSHLRDAVSYRDVEELPAERGTDVDTLRSTAGCVPSHAVVPINELAPSLGEESE
jgi:hypothetical protein